MVFSTHSTTHWGKNRPGRAAYGGLLGCLQIRTTNPKCNDPGIGYQAGSPYGLASRDTGDCLGVSRRLAMHPASAREHWLLTPPLPKREKCGAARIATPSQIRFFPSCNSPQPVSKYHKPIPTPFRWEGASGTIFLFNLKQGLEKAKSH